MAVKKLIIFIFSMILLPASTFAGLPSGVAVGEFRYSKDGKSIYGTITEVANPLVFTQNPANTAFFTALAPGFNSSTGMGTAYNIQITNPNNNGSGYLYKYTSTRIGTSDDKFVWGETIEINPYSNTQVAGPSGDQTGTTTPDSSATDTTDSAEDASPLDLTITGVGTSALPVPTKGCGANGKYTSGLLKGIVCDEPIKTLPQVLAVITNVMNQMLLPTAGTLFVIMFIVGGIVYMSSNGNEQRAGRAKKILTAAIVGLLITALAYSIVVSFVYLLGGSTK